MADKPWAFYPHPGGKKRRGLDLNGLGEVEWAACRTNDSRTESIWLPGPADAELSVDDPSIVDVKYGKTSLNGFRNVEIKSKAAGEAVICAERSGDGIAVLLVDVFAPLEMKVRFKKIKTEKWTSTLSAAKAQRLVENANYIYSYQGNITFTQVGQVQEINVPGMKDVVLKDDIDDLTEYRDCGADTTIFSVKEYNALAVSWRDLIIIEDSQTQPADEMTFAHEAGHRMGLDHPSPALPVNLMNQSSVGDRHRMKIFLQKWQIMAIRDKSKWNTVPNTDPHVCSTT